MHKNIPHWIVRQAYPGTSYPFDNCTCSECRYTVPMVLEEWKGRCPKCGTKLQEGDWMLRHMSVSIEGLLAMSDARMKKMLNSVKDEKGRQPSLEEFKEYLNHEWSLGHRLLPVPECDNFDPVRGCLGHPGINN